VILKATLLKLYRRDRGDGRIARKNKAEGRKNISVKM